MLTKHTLNTIQSGTEKEAYYTVTETALYMASGGYLEQANDLLSALWSYKIPHDPDTWLPDIAFMVLWHAAGSHPNYLPFELQDIDVIEKNMRGYTATDKWAYKMPDKPWTELKDQDLLRQALISAGLQTSGALPSAEHELASLTMLKKMMQEGYYSYDGLSLGAELAARHGQTNLAIQFAKTCVKKDPGSHSSHYLCLLASSRHVAPLLLQKVIATELGLTDTIVQEYLVEITRILDSRMVKGRSLVYGHLSWKELLEKISQEAIRVQGEESYDAQVYQTGWIGYKGATNAEIKNAEKKLGITLPEDYKAFLETTNGLLPLSSTHSPLLPVADIDYLKNALEPFLFDILLDYYTEEEEEAYKEKLSNTILISGYPDEQQLWLVPENKEKTSWQTWFFAHWVPGTHLYPGFRAYMEAQLELLLKRLDP